MAGVSVTRGAGGSFRPSSSAPPAGGFHRACWGPGLLGGLGGQFRAARLVGRWMCWRITKLSCWGSHRRQPQSVSKPRRSRDCEPASLRGRCFSQGMMRRRKVISRPRAGRGTFVEGRRFLDGRLHGGQHLLRNNVLPKNATPSSVLRSRDAVRGLVDSLGVDWASLAFLDVKRRSPRRLRKLWGLLISIGLRGLFYLKMGRGWGRRAFVSNRSRTIHLP